MKISLSIAAAVIAAAVVVTAGPPAAGAAPAALVRCGSVAAGGSTWQVGAVGLSCARARSLVQRLGALPTPKRLYYPGAYLGMRCLGGRKNGVNGIDCLSRNGRRSLVAVAR